ncbi:uncharacterized protein LY89DRAFT_556207, partial [Mollisia scopiformis]
LVTISVGIGAIAETFTVLKSVICHYSPFFNAAFNSQFKEGDTQSMVLNDADTNAFRLFVDWLYTQEIRYDDAETSSMMTLARLWILADRFLIPKLQNQTMKEFVSTTS